MIKNLLVKWPLAPQPYLAVSLVEPVVSAAGGEAQQQAGQGSQGEAGPAAHHKEQHQEQACTSVQIIPPAAPFYEMPRCEQCSKHIVPIHCYHSQDDLIWPDSPFKDSAYLTGQYVELFVNGYNEKPSLRIIIDHWLHHRERPIGGAWGRQEDVHLNRAF